jgi:KAP-like P-loop domain-containing protein
VAAFEDPVAWDEVLGIEGSEAKTAPAPGSSPLPNAPYYKPHYSAFTPDRAAFGPRATGPLDDALGVRTYARHLAQLIAAKDTFMPLSIGLFGAWGAGKSHFMDLLDEQLREITREPGRAFHKEIVQIRFNAWHYLDTNLWANLVSEIFDQLFATVERRGDDDARKLENLKSKLADQSALAAEAKAALVLAQNVREDAEEKLRAAMKARAAQENTVSTMLNDLKNLVVDDDLKQQLREVADGLGLPAIETSFNELEARAEEVRSLAGRGRAILLAVFTGPGWWRRATLLLAALLTPLAIAWLAANGGPRIEGLLTGASKYIAQFVTAVGFVSAWLGAQAKAGNALVGKLEAAYDKVTAIRARRQATDDAAKAQVALAQKQEAEEQARQNLRDAEEKVKNLQTEIAEMAPGRQLIRFLRARATAEDYRRHLGLVSLVRKDFDQLSRLLTEAPRDDDTLPKIDRIVLYIDDLDRCRADRVIEVLEAVHLLLAFPLFAVIVAVDPRWLRQSLLDHYPRLLGAMEKQTQRAGALGRPATPQDYLEKIFQVPFNLQPMEKPAFESLVKQLFSVGPLQSAALPSAVETQKELSSNAVLASQTKARKEAAIWADVSMGPDDQVSFPEPLEAPESKPIPPDPQRLVLSASEVKDIERFQLLFQTPRAVKRLANTYCLIRVGVAQDEWADYLGLNSSSPSYRVPLLLLAVTSAFPSLARAWLLWLRETPPTHWQLDAAEVEALASGNRDTTDGADWEKLQQCLNRLDLEGWMPPDQQLLAEWVPRVARYSF